MDPNHHNTGDGKERSVASAEDKGSKKTGLKGRTRATTPGSPPVQLSLPASTTEPSTKVVLSILHANLDEEATRPGNSKEPAATSEAIAAKGMKPGELEGTWRGKAAKPGSSAVPKMGQKKPGLRNHDLEEQTAKEPGASHTSSSAVSIPVLRGLQKNQDNARNALRNASRPAVSLTCPTASLEAVCAVQENQEATKVVAVEGQEKLAVDLKEHSDAMGLENQNESKTICMKELVVEASRQAQHDTTAVDGYDDGTDIIDSRVPRPSTNIATETYGTSCDDSTGSRPLAMDESEMVESETSFSGAFLIGTSSSRSLPQLQRYSNDGILVSAFVVEEEPRDIEAVKDLLRDEVREEIMQEVVGADEVQVAVVDTPTTETSGKADRQRCLVGLVFMLVLAAALAGGVAAAVGRNRNNGNESTNNQAATDKDGNADPLGIELPTLERVRMRGHVKCGVFTNVDGFNFNPDDGVQQGMNIKHCQAIALAALGDSTSYHLEFVNAKNRWDFLHNKSIDVLASTTTHTMERDVYESTTGTGFAFSMPFLYTGMAFGGVPEFVDCAENLDAFSSKCRNLKVCVNEGSTHVLIMKDIFPAVYGVWDSLMVDKSALLNKGTCNVIAADAISLPEAVIRANGLDESLTYKMGRRLFSREPLALATGQDDPGWTSLVNSVIELFYRAEALNLTSMEAQRLLDNGEVLPLDVETYTNNNLYDRMVRMVAEFGNYGELYKRTAEHFVPRSYPNYLHTPGKVIKDLNRSHGLLYATPFGNLNAIGSDPIPGKTLERVTERGFLICGVHPMHGFAEYNLTTREYSGLDAEFCKALNACIHKGETSSVRYVDVGAEEVNNTDVFLKLGVDVIAGERITLEKSLMSNVLFSTPYYYDNQGQSFAFATSPEDPQWSDLVYWTVMATIYAEEQGITMKSLHQEPSLMPSVGLFGERFKPMLYDSISAVGSYAEIYERSLQAIGVPRSSPNLLNEKSSGPQQFSFPMD